MENRHRLTATAVVGGIAVVFLTAMTIGIRRDPIESDLTRRANAALTAAGFDHLSTHFDGRDATVTGIATATDLQDAIELVDSLEGVRIVVGDATPATAEATTTTTSAMAQDTTTIPLATASDFSLESGEGSVTLNGRLPSQEAVDRLVAAAAAAFPDQMILDRITVDPAAAGPSWIGALETAIGTIGRDVTSPGLAVTGSGVSVAGSVADEQARIAALTDLAALGLPIEDGLSVGASPGILESDIAAVLNEATILFASGSAEVSAASAAALDQIADALGALPDSSVTVAGHTDDVGSTEDNQTLSEARAEAVVDYLVSIGTPPAMLTALGLGESRPIAPNTSEEGRAANRRIEFIVEGN